MSRVGVGVLGVLLTLGAPLSLRAGLQAYSTDCAVYTTAPCAAPYNFWYPLLQQMAQVLGWPAVPYVIIAVCMVGLVAGLALFRFAVNDPRRQRRLAYGVILALVGVILANGVKIMLLPVLLAPCLTSVNSPGIIGLPRQACTVELAPQNLEAQEVGALPVVAVLQAFPIVILALLVMSVILSGVGFYLRRQGIAATVIAESLQLAPLMLMVAIGVVALLPFVA
jgi:hypothetical protein